ncbi:MAG: hypothetical protein WA485_08290 [Candidatus Sulfotelmatobacter sp.]
MKFKCACLTIWFCSAMAFAQVTGSGSPGYVAGWKTKTSLASSVIFQSGKQVGVGTKTPGAELDVESSSATESAILGNNTATSGTPSGVTGIATFSAGVGLLGINNATNGGSGLLGISNATSGFANGVLGQTTSPGGFGVFGNFTATTGGSGVGGETSSPLGFGVIGINTSTSGLASGVLGTTSSNSGFGVQGDATATSGTTTGVFGQVRSASGIAGGFSNLSGQGLVLWGGSGTSNTTVFSVDASGNGFFAGNLSKGSGSFKIDHPLDPANKYLEHSFVESPDMMNIYNGVVLLDDKGEASVKLPDYFEALNSDYRYQLTAIGAPGPNLYVAEEISGNRFKIAGGKPGAKVSWQITGIRQDAYAKAHRIKVEEDKPAEDRGHYLHPELFGVTEKDAVGANSYPASTPGTLSASAGGGTR